MAFLPGFLCHVLHEHCTYNPIPFASGIFRILGTAHYIPTPHVWGSRGLVDLNSIRKDGAAFECIYSLHRPQHPAFMEISHVVFSLQEARATECGLLNSLHPHTPPN